MEEKELRKNRDKKITDIAIIFILMTFISNLNKWAIIPMFGIALLFFLMIDYEIIKSRRIMFVSKLIFLLLEWGIFMAMNS